MDQFKIGAPVSVTSILKRNFSKWTEDFDRILMCAEKDGVWVVRIQKGISKDYEYSDKVLLERSFIPYDDLYITVDDIIHADQKEFTRLVKTIFKADVDGSQYYWDSKEVDSIHEAIDLISGNERFNNFNEEEDSGITEKALGLVFPEISKHIKKIIVQWYKNENASEDFDDAQDFADFIEGDIKDMIDAGTGPEVSKVRRELKKFGYI